MTGGSQASRRGRTRTFQPRVRLRVTALESLSDEFHLELCLFGCHAGFQSRDRGKPTIVASGVLRSEAQRCPDLGKVLEAESRRHHPHDFVYPLVQMNRAPQNGGIGVETSLPHRVTDERYLGRSGPVVFLGEVAA